VHLLRDELKYVHVNMAW